MHESTSGLCEKTHVDPCPHNGHSVGSTLDSNDRDHAIVVPCPYLWTVFHKSKIISTKNFISTSQILIRDWHLNLGRVSVVRGLLSRYCDSALWSFTVLSV